MQVKCSGDGAFRSSITSACGSPSLPLGRNRREGASGRPSKSYRKPHRGLRDGSVSTSTPMRLLENPWHGCRDVAGMPRGMYYEDPHTPTSSHLHWQDGNAIKKKEKGRWTMKKKEKR